MLGEYVDKSEFETMNAKVIANGDQGAEALPILLGITKASLKDVSYLSAASFQETTKVLTDAAVAGRIDHLKGPKESIIVGKLIPIGTGYYAASLKKKAAVSEALENSEKAASTS